VGPQRLIGGRHMIFYQVLDHSSASAGVTTEPVKVEPVVPVRRTR
jgi:hypothetical protein